MRLSPEKQLATKIIHPLAAQAVAQHSIGTHLHTASMIFTAGVRLIRATPVLLLLFTAQLFIGAFVEGFFRLYRVHFLTNFTLPILTLPQVGALDVIVWFGIFDALNALLNLAGVELIYRKLNLNQPALVARVLLACYMAIITPVCA